MSKKSKTSAKLPSNVEFVKKRGATEEYRLKSNNLTILFQARPDTGVVTTNITYRVGARDEQVGETGAAHMLEHMLFKPTKHDIKRGTDSGAMGFERKTGCVLNANTWKDRTTYYFSYPTKYFSEALKIESERMFDTIVTEEELTPEKNNVLSEFDMYNGQAEFALAAAMLGSAFHSHPYGHETLGYREDIENYTAKTLDAFYKRYYRPSNATLMVVGDVDKHFALKKVNTYFGKKKNPSYPIERIHAPEPKQEGIRRLTIKRDTNTKTLAIGFKHEGFPTKDWFATHIFLEVLTGTNESILHKELIDNGLASSIHASLEPTSEKNLGYIFVTANKDADLTLIEQKILQIIANLKNKDISNLSKKTVARLLREELFARDGSLQIVRELTEYTAAGDWSLYYKTPDLLKGITPKEVLATKKLFIETNLTIGTYEPAK